MVDQAPSNVDVIASSAAPVASVSEAAPAITPSVDSSASTSSPATEGSAPAVEAKAESSAPATLLGAPEKPVAEVKKDEPAKPAEGEKPVAEGEATSEVAPAEIPTPTYEAFKLPEGFTADEAKLGEFTSLLGKLELAKGDHATTQEIGQALMDRHVAEVTSVAERMKEAYQNAWTKQTNDWKEAFIKDPEIGGNRQETTVNSALEFIRRHGGSPEQQAEFRGLMQSTGIGNHPAMIRILAKANSAMAEGKPLAASAPAMKQSKVSAMYGKKK